MTSIKIKNIHPIFKCSDLATHITQSTRSTQWAQTSLAKADHYSHKATVKILRLGGERLTHPHNNKKKNNKKKKVLDHYLHHNLVMLLPLGCFFCSFILLIYSSQKVPTSLKFYRALHIVVYICTESLMLILSIVFVIWKSNRAIDAAERKKERKKEELESYICKQM